MLQQYPGVQHRQNVTSLGRPMPCIFNAFVNISIRKILTKSFSVQSMNY